MNHWVPSPKEYLTQHIVQQQASYEDKNVLLESLEGYNPQNIWKMANELHEYILSGRSVNAAVLHILLVWEEDYLV